jgi:hypothetical protein
MTSEEINRAVAESVGFNWWAVEKGGWYYRQGGAGYTNRIEEAGRYTEADARKELVRGEPMGVHAIPPPDYCNDLNAMHEVEKTLTDEQHRLFRSYLGEAVGDVAYFCRKIISATARQRAEAYLRTIGKWRDA